MKKLDRIAIQGFKSFKSFELELLNLNVLIGPNGVGKSNFIGLFTLLNQMVEGNFQKFVRQSGGADAFLHYGQKVTSQIDLNLEFGDNSYSCSWVATVDDKLVFESEYAMYKPGDADSRHRYSLGNGHLESNLPNEVREVSWGVASYVLSSLKSWKVYHFHDTSDTSAIKRIGDINDNLYLRGDASNLAAFLYRLRNSEEKYYEFIRRNIQQVAPFFDDFILRPLPENEKKIQLEWRETGSDYPFLGHMLSDGTLRFICLATLLLQPTLPSTILIDEPELGLHPFAINLIASMIRSASQRTQVIVSTQSVPLVSEFAPEDILVVERKDHESHIRRLRSDELTGWLEDYSLGELWEKNVFGGRP